MIVIAGLALIVVVGVAGFAAVVTGIHMTERRRSLTRPPRGRAEALARRMLTVERQQPEIEPRCPVMAAGRGRSRR